LEILSLNGRKILR